MEKIFEQAMLYDFYGPLLTQHQKEIYESAVYENLSLGEIAESYGISRQSVHDLIKRCDKMMQEYEERLHLIARFEANRKKLITMQKHLTDNHLDQEKIIEMLQMIDEMIEEL